MNPPVHVLSEGARHRPLARPETKFISDPLVTSHWRSASRTGFKRDPKGSHVDVLIMHLRDKPIGQVILNSKEPQHEKKTCEI